MVVDQARIRRRGEDGVESPLERYLAGVAVDDLDLVCPAAQALERPDPLERVQEVAVDELRCLLHRPALAPMLVAPVRLALGRARKVEVEVRREAR